MPNTHKLTCQRSRVSPLRVHWLILLRRASSSRDPQNHSPGGLIFMSYKHSTVRPTGVLLLLLLRQAHTRGLRVRTTSPVCGVLLFRNCGPLESLKRFRSPGMQLRARTLEGSAPFGQSHDMIKTRSRVSLQDFPSRIRQVGVLFVATVADFEAKTAGAGGK